MAARHNFLEPQPEICELCGSVVPGHRLRIVVGVDGLDGYAVCDVTPSCAEFRAGYRSTMWRRHEGRPQSLIGDGRVFPPGADTFDQ